MRGEGGVRKILVIDDEPYITDIIRLFSERLDCQVDTADSANSALDKLHAVDSDYWAVFCDLKMPGLNGIELYHIVNEMKKNETLRFALLTGSIPDDEVLDMVREKKILYFRKPFTFQDFKSVMTELERIY
jgi:DNA-binding NtrC family response regulator